MKRDMELVRKILFELEKQVIPNTRFTIEGYNPSLVGYHCDIMHKAGLIKRFHANGPSNNLYMMVFADGLTWEGHDLLDKIRDDGTWKKTVKTIKEKGLDTSIKTIETIATAFITAATEGAVAAILKSGGTP